MTQTKNPGYMAAFTPEQLKFFYGFPLWAVAAWGVGVWGGVLGSLLLVLRRRWSTNLCMASLAGMVATDLYAYVLANGLAVMKGPGAMIFSSLIFVIGVLLLNYASAMRRRGLLR